MTEHPNESLPAAPFEVGAEVKHKAVEDFVGVVEDITPGVEDGTWNVAVAWPAGAPVELTSNKHHAASNLEPVYPVCDNCGQRHEQTDPEEALEVVKLVILREAGKLVQENPGQFPELEKAFAYGAAIAREVQIRAFAKLLGEAPTAEEPDGE